MQPFSLEKPVAHSTASKFSAVLIGRIVSSYIYIYITPWASLLELMSELYQHAFREQSSTSQ